VADEVLELGQGNAEFEGKLSLGGPASELRRQFHGRPFKLAGALAERSGEDVHATDGIEDGATNAADGEAGECRAAGWVEGVNGLDQTFDAVGDGVSRSKGAVAVSPAILPTTNETSGRFRTIISSRPASIASPSYPKAMRSPATAKEEGMRWPDWPACRNGASHPC
jgi:hypothetical protein